jgi:hypothetical protein
MQNWKMPGTKLKDRAYMYDKSGNVHTGDALFLAMLLVARGNAERKQDELVEVSRLMNDHNLSKEQRGNRRRTSRSNKA